MASASNITRSLLKSALQLPRFRRASAAAPSWQPTCYFSETSTARLPGSAFSVSFPLEFDDKDDSGRKTVTRGRPKEPSSELPRATRKSVSPKTSNLSPTPEIEDYDVKVRKGHAGGAKPKKAEAPAIKKGTRTAQGPVEIDDATNEQLDDLASTSDSIPPATNSSKTRSSVRKGAKKEAKTSAAQPRKKRKDWQIQKQALEKKFGETGWSPRKKLSPDTIEGIRALHEQFPDKYTTPMLAEEFKVSPEAIRRILKGKWRPDSATMDDRRERWARRHDRIWDQKAALGQRPQRTKDRKIESPDAFEEERRARQILANR